MPGLFDLLMAARGAPLDPTAQIRAGLGQAPGQPGGAPSPVPGAPPVPQGGSPGGGGPPSPPSGGPQAAPGGPSATSSAPPATMPGGAQAPQALQSPSDLSQMYLQLAQRASAERSFNSGLAMIAAGAYPGRTPGGVAALSNAMNAGAQDPGSMFGNLLQLQQFQQQQQRYAALQQGLPAMLKDAGLSQDYAPIVMQNPGLLGDILKVRMGITGDPAERALQAARNDWLMRNPGKTESDMLAAHPEFSDAISYAATKTGQATTASSIAKDLATDRDAAQKTLPALVTSTGDMLTNLDKIIGASDADLGNYVGGPVAALKPLTGAGASMTTNPALAGALDQVVKQTFGEGFREVAGKTSRVTNTEATSLSGSLSQLQNRGLSPADFRTQAQIVKDRLLHTLGTAYGEAGQSDNLPDYLKGADSAGNPYLDSEYAPPSKDQPGGSRYWRSGGNTPPGVYPGLPSAAPKPPAPAGGGGGQTSSDLRGMSDADASAAYAKLPPGATYIGPDGKMRRKGGS